MVGGRAGGGRWVGGISLPVAPNQDAISGKGRGSPPEKIPGVFRFCLALGVPNSGSLGCMYVSGKLSQRTYDSTEFDLLKTSPTGYWYAHHSGKKHVRYTCFCSGTGVQIHEVGGDTPHATVRLRKCRSLTSARKRFLGGGKGPRYTSFAV